MHNLVRPIQPSCLNKYQHGLDNWRSVTPEHKSEIWSKLDEMQQHRCAYCEAAIKTERSNSNAHIEHLRQRMSFPQGTFLWSNLFGSCNRQDSCGKHKDNLAPYNHQDLIKMDEEDPERFFDFLPDGNVVPVKGLRPEDKHRAEETIRVFNLNGALRQIRETAVKGYLQTAEEFSAYAADPEIDEADWLSLLQEELDRIKNLPFTTAIKHVLLPA